MKTTTTEFEKASWPLSSFSIDNYKLSGQASLVLDRAHSEFGLVTHIASGITILEEFVSRNEPIYFQASKARAACYRANRCKKACILMPSWQIDLEFTTVDLVQQFMDALKRCAKAVGNTCLDIYDVPSNIAFTRSDFDMVNSGIISRSDQLESSVSDTETTDWNRLYATGLFSDFTIVAENKTFLVHRARLCLRSGYFNVVCNGPFMEASKQSIQLPEKANIISLLLDELYNVFNPTTGSIFTCFALQSEIEKDLILGHLLNLFIACDKYDLVSTKRKVADMIIDRLPFVHDVLTIVDLAISVHDEQVPQNDSGLRRAVIAQLQARHAAIVEHEGAWQAFSGNKDILKAFHCSICYGNETSTSEFETTLCSPQAEKRKRT